MKRFLLKILCAVAAMHGLMLGSGGGKQPNNYFADELERISAKDRKFEQNLINQRQVLSDKAASKAAQQQVLSAKAAAESSPGRNVALSTSPARLSPIQKTLQRVTQVLYGIVGDVESYFSKIKQERSSQTPVSLVSGRSSAFQRVSPPVYGSQSTSPTTGQSSIPTEPSSQSLGESLIMEGSIGDDPLSGSIQFESSQQSRPRSLLDSQSQDDAGAEINFSPKPRSARSDSRSQISSLSPEETDYPEENYYKEALRILKHIALKNKGIPADLFLEVQIIVNYFVNKINYGVSEFSQSSHVFIIQPYFYKFQDKVFVTFDGGHLAGTCEKLQKYGLVEILKQFEYQGFMDYEYKNLLTNDTVYKTEFPSDFTMNNIKEIIRKIPIESWTKDGVEEKEIANYYLIPNEVYLRMVRTSPNKKGKFYLITAYPVIDKEAIEKAKKLKIHKEQEDLRNQRLSGQRPLTGGLTVAAQAAAAKAAKAAKAGSAEQGENTFSVRPSTQQAPVAQVLVASAAQAAADKLAAPQAAAAEPGPKPAAKAKATNEWRVVPKR
ncbi:MAG: hypothetical protein NTZ68_00215 [Candidatus Dependentiae bacterium]|nr:hypothetical protein [Candidatus Dependentiae bacterium]